MKPSRFSAGMAALAAFVALPAQSVGQTAPNRDWSHLLSSTACYDWSKVNQGMSLPRPPTDRHAAEKFHGKKIKDPFRPLETDSPETIQWVTQQQALTDAFTATQAQTHARAIHAMEAAIPGPSEKPPLFLHGKYYSYAMNPQGQQEQLLVRDTLNGPARVLLDIDSFSADGTTSLQRFFVSPKGVIAYQLTAHGRDDGFLRFRDVNSGRDLPDRLPPTMHLDIMWDFDGNGFVYQAPDPAQPKRMVLKHHVMGTDSAADTVMLANAEWNETFLSMINVGSVQLVLIGGGVGEQSRMMIRDRDNPDFRPSSLNYFNPQAADGKNLYIIEEDSKGFGALVRLDMTDADNPRRTTILKEDDTQRLSQARVVGGKIFVEYIRDNQPALYRYSLDGVLEKEIPLPKNRIFNLYPLPAEGALLIHASNLIDRGDVYRYDVTADTLTKTRSIGRNHATDNMVIEQHMATSRDGTRVPYTIVRPRDLRIDGTAAANLYSYGGFRNPIPQKFNYNALSWVEAGGIFVHAHLRGGGEYGHQWYTDGILRNKQNTFDDLAAVAADLAARKYTSPQRTMLTGASNGGLTVLATAIQRPDMFGAVIASVPVADMLRFDRFTYGHYWRGNYGVPAGNADDFKTIMTYSPLHNVRKGVRYPATMTLTADNDTRVVPLHSYKMTAAFQTVAGPETLSFLYVQKNAGHGTGMSRTQFYERAAISITFAARAIGPIAQDDYAAFDRAQADAAKTSRDVAQCRAAPYRPNS